MFKKKKKEEEVPQPPQPPQPSEPLVASTNLEQKKEEPKMSAELEWLIAEFRGKYDMTYTPMDFVSFDHEIAKLLFGLFSEVRLMRAELDRNFKKLIEVAQ